MRRYVGLIIIMLWAATGFAAPESTESYDFPFENRWVATVVGTPPEYRADLPEKIPVKERALKVFENREVPEVFWYNEELRYSYALQRKRAPLVFIIAGTGGAHDGTKNKGMARAFYQAGFHIVSLTSPSHSNFVVAASETSVPGHAYKDAQDLYRVMELIWATLKTRIEVTDFYVTGFSLGAFNAAFVTLLDEEKQVFKFRKALLINPPLRLYNSISLLDRMIDNIPGGSDNFDIFFDELVQAFAQTFKREDRLTFDDETLYRAYEALQPKNEELAAVIGVAFRMSAANMIFTSDVMTNYGYIKPQHIKLTKNTNLDQYNHVTHGLGFTDYFHLFFYPYYLAEDPSVTREGLAAQTSLAHIEDYLRSADHIEVMHNQDDIILAPGEIDFFPRVFGERAKIYPRGGHCGNMEHRDNVAHMVSVFKN